MNRDHSRFIRWKKEDYVDLSEETVRERLLKLNIYLPNNPDAALDEMMRLEYEKLKNLA